MYRGMCIGDNAEKHSFPVRLYISDIPDDKTFLDAWYGKMPKERKDKCDRFKIEADKNRCITAYALLVHALSDLGINCSDTLVIKEGADGKPYIPDTDVFFNISHSGQRCAVALSPAKVGCDVERRGKDVLKVAKRFFAPAEYSYLGSIEDDAFLNIEFTKIWTMKESFVKCLGEGIRHGFCDFSCTDENGTRTGAVDLAKTGERYHIKEYDSEHGYCYSVCSIFDEMEDRARHVSLR